MSVQLLHSLSVTSPSSSSAKRELDIITVFVDSDTVHLDESTANRIMSLVIKNRLCNSQWIDSKPCIEWITSLAQLARLIVRDKVTSQVFDEESTQSCLVKLLDLLVKRVDADKTTALVCILGVVNKFSCSKWNSSFVNCGLHRAVLPLLHSSDMNVLQGTLELLSHLSDSSEKCRVELCSTTVLDVCLQLTVERDLVTQKLCVSLLRILACEEAAREQIKIYDGIPLLVRLISVRNTRLQWHTAWTLAQLADDMECAVEIGQRGAIAMVLAELSRRDPPSRGITDWLSMMTGLNALLAQLSQVDSNEIRLVKNNGIFIVGQLLLLYLNHSQLSDNVQFVAFYSSVFRVLRLIFSRERNRHYFKRLFSPSFFAKFIDIGHFIHDLSAYKTLSEDYLAELKSTVNVDQLYNAWNSVNQDRPPLGEVGEYQLMDQLGAGAFGCVYTVRKKNAPSQLYALKEIYMLDSTEVAKDKSFGDVISEVRIIKQQLRHPNIVRYRRIFVDNQRLYIVMDLIDGTSLKDHIQSMAEKKIRTSEARVWNVIVQLVLALRYLHKDKQIVHRDLKPSNIMLGEEDRVVITDFGLAKQRTGTEYLNSAAGTIIYSCPEIVQDLPYGDKADIWSFGCCIYELCNLHPTFHSHNMLKLTLLIVEGSFDPVVDTYSQQLRNIINACLRPSPSNRPDIIQVGEMMVDKFMTTLDTEMRMNVRRTREESTSLVLPSITSSSSMSSVNIQTKRNSSFARTESLNSSNGSEVLSSAIREVREKEEKKRTRLPMINNCIEKVVPRRRKDVSLKSFSAGSRSTLSQSLPRITGAIPNPSSHLSVNTHSRRASSSSSVDRNDRLNILRSTNLRPIADPVLQMLSVLHRLLIVTDECAPDVVNHRRRLLIQFRRRLFSKSSTAEEIKIHLRKLSTESTDIVPLDLGYSDYTVVLSELPLLSDMNEEKVTRVTYEQVYAVLQLAYSQLAPLFYA